MKLNILSLKFMKHKLSFLNMSRCHTLTSHDKTFQCGKIEQTGDFSSTDLYETETMLEEEEKAFDKYSPH
jgi:hypothetical protein